MCSDSLERNKETEEEKDTHAVYCVLLDHATANVQNKTKEQSWEDGHEHQNTGSYQ